MVTLRYRKQQAEEAARKERLVAARQAAGAVSLHTARQYSAQKTSQSAQVRQELRTRWALEQQEKAMAVDALLDHAEAHRAEGLTEASRLHSALVDTAKDELSAWAAEHMLEDARFRLATAYVAADDMARSANALDGAARRAKVRDTEKARAARVAAAAPPASPAAALAEVRAGMERFDQQPLHGAPFCARQVNVPRDVRMSAVAYPPRCTPGALFRHPDDDPAARAVSAVDAAAALVRQREADDAARAESLRLAQSTASARAERGLRESRAAAERAKQAEDAARARRREVAEVYRHAQETDEDEAAAAAEAAAGVLPATHRQQAQQAARDAEAAFVRDFVDGPPVLVPGVPPAPLMPDTLGGVRAATQRGGIPVEQLLRPVRVQDLLPEAVSDSALPAVPMAAAPLLISVFASEPRAPTPVASRTAVDARQPEITPEAAPETATDDASPIAADVREPCDDEPAVETHEVPSSEASVEAEDAEVVDVVEVSRVTEPAAESLSASTASQTSSVAPSVPAESSSSDTSEPTWVMDESATSGGAADSPADTTFTSTSSSSMRPTMTAEQLKLALIRLRNRMRAAQL